MKQRTSGTSESKRRPGQREIMRGSRIYPMSGPLPRGNAPIRSEAELGHAVRGGANRELLEAKSREIPLRQWAQFFNEFSVRHEGWLAEVEVLERGEGSRIEARRLPFEGITADTKTGALNTISVILEMQSNVHLTHMVPRARKVHVKDEPELEIQITAANGERTIVRFHEPPHASGLLPVAKTKRTEAG